MTGYRSCGFLGYTDKDWCFVPRPYKEGFSSLPFDGFQDMKYLLSSYSRPFVPLFKNSSCAFYAVAICGVPMCGPPRA